jgi:hypothetical protein
MLSPGTLSPGRGNSRSPRTGFSCTTEVGQVKFLCSTGCVPAEYVGRVTGPLPLSPLLGLSTWSLGGEHGFLEVKGARQLRSLTDQRQGVAVSH